MATLLIIAQKLVAMFEDAKSLKELSEREREVCDLLLKGLSAVQVG